MIDASTLLFATSVQVYENYAAGDGGGVWVGAGAIARFAWSSLDRNYAAGNGGGIAFADADVTVVRGCEFKRNSAGVPRHTPKKCGVKSPNLLFFSRNLSQFFLGKRSAAGERGRDFLRGFGGAAGVAPLRVRARRLALRR